jgi:hypothetical protein
MHPPSGKGFSKSVANSGGLVMQLGEVEAFHTLWNGGCAKEEHIMVLWEFRRIETRRGGAWQGDGSSLYRR